MTRSYAVIELSDAAQKEIYDVIKEAGQLADRSIDDGALIDLNGLALQITVQPEES